MYLATSDLYTVIYEDIINEIVRNDDTIPEKAIASAIAEAKAYLSRFDLAALFGTTEDEPTIEDEWLKSLVKDVAAWQLIKLANPNISTEMLRARYEDATAIFKNIQKGIMVPQNWPYFVPESTDPLPGAAVSWSSSTQLNNDI